MAAAGRGAADDREPGRAARKPVAALPPFELVARDHGPAVLRFCVARAGAHAGEDAFQETMIAALRAYPELRDPGAVRGWLFSIAHRKTIDAARAAQRAPVPVGGSDELVERVAGAADGAIGGRGSGGLGGPDGDAAAMPGPVWVHVRALPVKQREAVTLRYLADLTAVEIAEVMGTSPEAARRSVFEGLRRLRALVGDDDRP